MVEFATLEAAAISNPPGSTEHWQGTPGSYSTQFEANVEGAVEQLWSENILRLMATVHSDMLLSVRIEVHVRVDFANWPRTSLPSHASLTGWIQQAYGGALKTSWEFDRPTRADQRRPNPTPMPTLILNSTDQ